MTVQPAGGTIRFQNNSKGTVQVVADLDGYYGAGEYGFQPMTPVRVLDTRNGTTAAGPVAARGTLRRNLSGKVPAGAAAAAAAWPTFYNDSGGTVQLVADLDGYFSSGATSSFVPYGPTRIVTHASASARKLAPFRRTARW